MPRISPALDAAMKAAGTSISPDEAIVIAAVADTEGADAAPALRGLLDEATFERGAFRTIEAALARSSLRPARRPVHAATPTQGGAATAPTQGPVQGGTMTGGCSDGSCGDTTPPRAPYSQVVFGLFVDAARVARDPLVMKFSGLEKNASLYLINRRDHLDADKSDRASWVKIPWDGALDADGRAAVVLSDDAAKELGVAPGDILEIFQTDRAGNVSPSDWVAVNEGAPGGRVANPLGGSPTTWIGVQSDAQRAQLLLHPDPAPPATNAAAISQRLVKSMDRWELALTPQKGKLAIEPFAKVIVDRPPFYTGHYTQDVKRDGSFEIKTWDAQERDAVVLRVLDHSSAPSWKMGDGAKATERRIVLAAGGTDAVVVENPARALQKQLEASDGRIVLGQDRIEGAAGAATPGAIVLVINQASGAKTTTAVGSDGSFCHALKANVGDPISIQLLHAFDEPGLRKDLGIHEVACDARALGADAAKVGDGAAGRLRVAIEDASLYFSTYDWNTGNGVSVQARTDWSGQTSSVAVYDAAKGELVVTIDVERAQNDGSVRTADLGDARATHAFFGHAGTSSWSNGNPDAVAVRQEVARRGVGGTLPVRFQTTDGHEVAHATLVISSEVHAHSTGSSQKDHPVFIAKIQPGSLVNV